MRLQIFKDVPSRLPVRKLTALFDAVVSSEGQSHWAADINLIFTDDERIRSLNNEFRNKDRHTDVLSFVLDEPAAEDDTFGEIYISLPTARRQAKEYRTTVTQELLRLFGHGLLHLFGHDHTDENETKVMMNLEQRYLDKASQESN